MSSEKNCPRCGEKVKIYDFAELRPSGVNVFYKCGKCWTSFSGKFFEYDQTPNPFTKSERGNKEE